MFCAGNDQNIDSTVDMTDSFFSETEDKPPDILVIPSRVDFSEGDQINLFKNDFIKNFEKFKPNKLKEFDQFGWWLNIPYVPYYSYKERCAVREKQTAIAEPLVHSYSRVARTIALLAPNNSKLKKVYGPDETFDDFYFAHTEPVYDVFISYNDENTKQVKNLISRLYEEVKGDLRICTDKKTPEQRVKSFTEERKTTRAIHSSKCILLVASPEWLKKEWKQVEPELKKRSMHTMAAILAGEDEYSEKGFAVADLTGADREDEFFRICTFIRSVSRKTDVELFSVSAQYLKKNVVCILNNNNVGTGFFIDSKGLLLTCLDNLTDKETGKLKNKYEIIFNRKSYYAELVFPEQDSSDSDIAVLGLAEKRLPPTAELLPLGIWKYDTGLSTVFSSYGFIPEGNNYQSLFSEGKIKGLIKGDISEELLQLMHESGKSEKIQMLSGAPVYHKTTGQTVGMIGTKKGIKTENYAIPIEKIKQTIQYSVPSIADRMREEEIFYKISETFHIGEWLTEKSLRSLYDNLPFPNMKKYDDLEPDKPRSILEQLRLNARGRVNPFIKYISRKSPDVLRAVKLESAHRFNFVNRNEELAKSSPTDYSVPFILYEAPAGYGKTKLLEEIEDIHFQKDWLSVYTRIDKDLSAVRDISVQLAYESGFSDISKLPNIDAVNYKLAISFEEKVKANKAAGVILLIDNIEKVKNQEGQDEIILFIDKFIRALRTILQTSGYNLKIRLACDHVGSEWAEQIQKQRIGIEIVPLSLFCYRDIRELIKGVVSFNVSDSETADAYACHLMNLTGGHPDSIVRIIELAQPDRPAEEFFRKQQKNCEQIVLNAANDIWNSVPENQKEQFNTLSLFRRYNRSILQRIIDHELVSYKGDAFELEEEILTANYFIKRVIDNRFIEDKIFRRMLAIRLRLTDFDRFVRLSEKASEIYETELREARSHHEYIATEVLIHQLQLEYYKSDQSGDSRKALREKFFADTGILHQCLKILFDRPEKSEIKSNFLTLSDEQKGDWEFQFAVNFFLRDEKYTDEPCNLMKEKTEKFFSKR
ncbi:MAG: trypsin-like peptidase domain-containing protein [Desulfobacteraceae bacterium]|nr:trypsin-like peptidase domain-containing protein [Desulfobacteraceae bacterium]